MFQNFVESDFPLSYFSYIESPRFQRQVSRMLIPIAWLDDQPGILKIRSTSSGNVVCDRNVGTTTEISDFR